MESVDLNNASSVGLGMGNNEFRQLDNDQTVCLSFGKIVTSQRLEFSTGLVF